MAARGDEAPQRIKGTVIKRSLLTACGMLVFLMFLLLVGPALLCAWWTEFDVPLPAGDLRITSLGGIIGGIACFLAPLMMAGIIAMLVIGEQIVLGEERMQIVTRSGKVTLQIPYANIAKVSVVNDQGVKYLGLNLADLEDPDTFASNWDFAEHRKKQGWHYTIQSGFQRSIDEIHDLILEHTEE
jgi:hypothetical protein